MNRRKLDQLVAQIDTFIRQVARIEPDGDEIDQVLITIGEDVDRWLEDLEVIEMADKWVEI